MHQLTTVVFFLLFCFSATAQYEYEANKEYPFGRANPDAPEQIKDFQAMIGECNCTSTARNQDGSWAASQNMIWRFKYIMNGWGVQDETLKEDGSHSGSIRQYIDKEGKWFVHYYSNKGPTQVLPAWNGNLKEGEIILYREQKAPNGMDGFYKITFYEMDEKGYKWKGAWVSPDESIVYPTWKIECKR